MTPRLRAVTVDLRGTTVVLTITYDGDYDEDLWEIANVVGVEVIGDFPEPWMIEDEIRFRGVPLEPYERTEGRLVFLRRE